MNNNALIPLLRRHILQSYFVNIKIYCHYMHQQQYMYRIYSRISQEILDVFLNFFSQFDLYAGQTLPSLKYLRIGYFFILKIFINEKRI
jgi:hypothetical protein